MRDSSSWKVVLAVVVTILFWASAFAGVRAALTDFSPGQVALGRFIFSAALMGVVAAIYPVRLPKAKDFERLLIASLLGITLYHLALNFGEVTINAATAGFLIATCPIFIALFSHWFLKESLRFWGWVAILVSFLGVSFIAFGKGSSFQFQPGALLIAFAAALFAVYAILQRRLLKTCDPLSFSALTIWIGGLPFLGALPGLWHRLPEASLSSILSLAYLGLFPGGFSFLTWTYAMSKMTAPKLSSFLYIQPLWGLVIAWLWLGEVPSMISFGGGFLALIGVWLLNTHGLKKAAHDTALPR